MIKLIQNELIKIYAKSGFINKIKNWILALFK